MAQNTKALAAGEAARAHDNRDGAVGDSAASALEGTTTARLATIRRTLTLLHESDSIVELRILHAGRNGTVSGYFTDMDKLATAAAQWSGQAPGVYVTLNPCTPDLLARAANRVISHAKHTTGDKDILHRRWLPIDFDPARPAGILSTDAEHEAALERAAECRAWLQKELGWPKPIAADSGNGGHVLSLVDLPNDQASAALLKRCLEALAFLFSDNVVKVDLTIYNTARIWKLYGTMACKGDHTPERPHRLSRLLKIPMDLQVVTREQLEALAAMVPQQPKAEGRRAAHGKPFDLERWIDGHNLPVVQVKPWNGGRVWVLNPCPWNADHTNKSAYIVQLANGAIAARCFHNGCADNDWHALRALYDGAQVGQTATEDSTACPYEATEHGLVWLKPTRDGAIPIPLTNFAAEIVADTLIDDGVEQRRTFTLTATLDGCTITFDVPAAHFTSMAWSTEHLGAAAFLYPGQTVRDHARTAVQMLSHQSQCPSF